MTCRRTSLVCFTTGLLSLLMLFLIGCGGKGTPALGLAPAAADGFSLQVAPESFLGEAPTGRFTLSLNQDADTVKVEINVADAQALKACYFSLTYDPQQYSPLSAKSSGLLPGTAISAGGLPSGDQVLLPEASLELAVLDRAGTVHYGEVLTRYQQQVGFSGDGVLATVRFARQPFSPRAASEPPTTDASQTEAEWDPQSRVLGWRYYCQGDYDQNSEVNIADLSALGANFGAIGPFDPTDALSVIDGDSNGELNISDISPIGANFQRKVEGYDVYASLDPADLPEDNAAPPVLPALDFVPFDDYFGNPQGERIRFFREYPELDPDSILWVRPVSDASAGTPSTPQQPTTCNWLIRNISAYATVTTSATHSSLALVDGLPALLYQDIENQQLVYQRALDLTGYAWSSEAVVDESGNGHFTCSLAEVEGLPAAVHHEETTGALEFIRATDPRGTTWGEPLVLDTTASSGWDCHLLAVHGHPAVCYMDLESQQLKYLRATDPVGGAWDAIVEVADLGSSEPIAGAWSSIAMIGEYPAIAFFHAGNQELRYVSALDASGDLWATPVTVATGTEVGRYCCLCDVHGLPAISYLNDRGLAYIRATNAEGTAWGSEVAVDTRFGPVAHLDTWLAMVHERPAICYYSGTDTGDLLFARALDPEGATWGTPVAIDSYDSVGRSTTMLMVGDWPAISYLDETSSQAKFAICVDEVNQEPAAVLYALPSRADVDEEITLDASLSYDPDGEIERFEWDLDDDGIFELNTGPEATVMHSFEFPGRYFVAVRVFDADEAQATASVWVAVGDLGESPVAALTADPLDVDISESIAFDASASADPDGEIVLYEWDLDCDGDFEMNTGVTPNINHEYAETGIFNPSVKITDDIGLADIASISINVGQLNMRPVAVLTGNPLAGNAPFTVYLDGSQSYDPDGSIVKYEWDLDNDGVYEIDGGVTATWAWLCELPGDQRLRLRVTDNLGATDTTWVLCSSNQWPVAKLSATPHTGTAPFAVTFDGSQSYDPDGSIVAYAYDVNDDGSYEHSATGPPPASWQYTLIWNGPVKVRLKVKDDEGAYGSTVYTIQVNKGWHIRTIDPIGWAGWFNSLAEVYGTPAIAYYEYQSRSLKFVRATDSLGINAWSTPVNIGPIAMTGYTAYGVRLGWFNGTTPGIAFCGCMYNNPSYVYGKNSQGTQWNPFVTALSGNVAPGFDICVVNQKPAIATHMQGIRFIPAKDYIGTAWDKSVEVAKTPGCLYGNTCALAVVSGNPAIVYCERIPKTPGPGVYDVLTYVRATDAAGSKWGTPVVIDNKDDPADCALAVIDGRPAVAYVANPSYFEVRYKRANDPLGASWQSAAIQVKADGRTVLGLVQIDGKPAIGLVTCGGHDVMYFHAQDAIGSKWPAGQVVDASDQNVGLGAIGGQMISLSGHPAMSYHHSVKADLKYAVWE